MRGISGLIGLAVLALGISSCGGGGDGGITPPPGGGGGGGNQCPANTVCMAGSTFFPTTLTVAPGTSVNFTNGSGVTHNVVFDGATITDIPAHDAGTNARTFPSAGTYNFHCDFHAPGMTGKVVVQ